jgi:hypothetical protein
MAAASRLITRCIAAAARLARFRARKELQPIAIYFDGYRWRTRPLAERYAAGWVRIATVPVECSRQDLLVACVLAYRALGLVALRPEALRRAFEDRLFGRSLLTE